jgi:predicted nucleic acid-binding protein
MIVVDSSVWINHFRDTQSRQVLTLREIEPDSIIAGDLIILEVLRGLRTEEDAVTLQRKFDSYGVTPMLDPRLAFIGAAYYRALRSRGVTVKRLADLIIATYCIELGHHLLHQDRDFDAFETHLGLRIVKPASA